ncbi:MAG: gliding motility-associated C-terminal domain-containing protein [Bacteroidota bacterium]
MTRYIFPVFFLMVVVSLNAQYLANPSFEGPPGIGISPPDWLPFDPASTPDTEPLNCDNYPASDGDTYITLVARGSGSPDNPNTVENCQTQLTQSLNAGECYSLNMDLASRDDLGHYVFGEGFIYYTEGVALRVYGSSSSSEKGELLLETEAVENIQWERISATVKPGTSINYLLFEVSLTTASAANGNLLIDNFSIDHELVSTVMLNETLVTSDLPFSLEASESSSYSWSPNSGLSCYDCRSPEVNSNVDRTYTCTLISPISGCPENELFILSFTDDSIPTGDFKIPNVFTPNGDGINDRFEVTGLPPYSSLMVFDRSGKEIFKSETYQNEWDGTDLDGNPLPSDTYWYVLITPGLTDKHKGFVHLKID